MLNDLVTLVRKEYEKLDNEKSRIEERIKGATQQAEVEMKKARAEAFEIGLKEEDMSLLACIERLEKITKSTLSAAGDCGIKKPSFSEPTTEGDVSKELKKVKETIKSCRMQITATSRFSELQRDWKQVNDAKKEFEETSAKVKGAIEEHVRMEKEWGTIEHIEKTGKWTQDRRRKTEE